MSPSRDGRGSVHAVILAGGRGERLWPRSRADLPKQFLPVVGDETLFQGAVRRARRAAGPQRVHVVTGEAYRDLVKAQAPDLPEDNLLLEPAGRNTAASIGLAAAVLQRREPDAVLLVMPADHLVWDDDRFQAVMEAAAAAARDVDGLVTVGLRPTRPETGYGYIAVGDLPSDAGLPPLALPVERFTEKPDLEHALAFVQGGRHLWNAGIFAWRAPVILRELARHLPAVHAAVERLAAEADPPSGTFPEAARLAWEALDAVSVDYGILERADDVFVVPGDFGWDDLGAWPSLERVCDKDTSGNVLRGPALAVEAEANIVENTDPSHLVVAFGLRNTLVVHSGDVILVADKTSAPELKRVLAAVEGRGLGRYLRSGSGQVSWNTGAPALPLVPGSRGPARIVEKPWGREVWWALTERYVGKLIEVRAGHSLSLQYHRRKMETLLFTRGEGVLVLGGEHISIQAGLTVTIPPGTVHRVEARTDLAFFEASTPEVEDVVRLQDRYGRTDLGGDDPGPLAPADGLARAVDL